MKIGIIGFGVVGKAAAKTFDKEYEIKCFDKFLNLDSFESIAKCDFVFIMVPTPFDVSKNKVDDSAILETLEKLDGLSYSGIVIIKSTIAPGFTDFYIKKYNLDIVFNPEFLRESTTPNADFKNQDTIFFKFFIKYFD